MNKNTWALLRNVKVDNPLATQKEHFEVWYARLLADPTRLKAVLRESFEKHYPRFEVVQRSANTFEVVEKPSVEAIVFPRREHMVVRHDRAKYGAAQKETSDLARRLRRVVVCMKDVMPNGMPLESCQAGYVRELGGVYVALVKGLRDRDVVGKYRKEQDLQNLVQRFAKGS